MEISKEELDYLLQQEYNRGYNAGVSKTGCIPAHIYYGGEYRRIDETPWTCDSMARNVEALDD